MSQEAIEVLADKLFEENKVKVEEAAGTAFYRFNVTMEPFNNMNIRKAFAEAVDRQPHRHAHQRLDQRGHGHAAARRG